MATGRYNRQPEIDGLMPAPNLLELATGTRRKRAANVEELELRIAALERERREVHRDLLDAAHVQRRLSGPRQMRRGGFDIASEVFPVRHLAGDFVSAMDIGDQTWIALGDIAGKGIAAAMWFTHLVSMIHCQATSERSPAAIMAGVNHNLCDLQPTPPITTMVLLRLDWKTGKLEYCNAGHPPVLLVSAGSVRRLDVGGPILGVISRAPFEAAQVTVDPGELLLGFSDGVLECRNGEDQEFGEQRLVTKARDHGDGPAQAILFSLLGALQDFAAEAPPHDDVSLLVIRNDGLRS